MPWAKDALGKGCPGQRMPLQKSFSETNHSAKNKNQPQRSQWSRNKTYQGQQAPNPNVDSRPLQEQPQVLLSTATKDKLLGFQFQGRPDGKKTPVISLLSDDEKENQSPPHGKLRGTKEEQIEKESEDLPTVLQPSKSIPSTPAGRLALPDLIGMGDAHKELHNISPDERIQWDHNKDGLYGQTRFSDIRGAKKRARSSSPMSSPARAPTHFSPNGANSSPQVDPGSELWGRYSLNGSGAPTPQGAPVPALAHLLYTSSPQPSKEGATPRSVGGFRRANSCGNQFPKRRRLGGSDGDDVFTETATVGPSKLSVLIERVQEGLSQTTMASNPNQSFHVPCRRQHSDSRDDLQAHQGHGKELELPSAERADTQASKKAHMEEENSAQPVTTSVDSSSSDYGEVEDDELADAYLFEGLEKMSAPLPADISRTTQSKPSQMPLLPTPRNQYPAITEPSNNFSGATKAKDDEFDDSDDDAFTADLENMLSQYDHTPILKERDVAVKGKAGGESGPLQISRVSKSVLDDDEFGDDGLDDIDFEAAEATATQSIQKTANSLWPPTQKKQAIQRYLVTNILPDSEYASRNGRCQQEKILLLQIEQTNTTKVVHLRGTWVETPVTVKAYVHVIGLFDSSGRCIIDDNNNLLILHPDHLISSTVVADSFGCTRRAVLQDRVKATSDSSAPLVYGTILHEIFQAAMLENRWDTSWLDELIEEVATRHVEDLYTIQLQIPQAVEYLRSKMPEMQSWAELFVSSRPNPEAIVKDRNGEKAVMCVSKLLDVEEHVWSPMYGLKGNIDATVQVTMKDGDKKRTLTVPFEVKTGKSPSTAHRAQTALYNLLLSDRYDIEIAYGILYYMETSEIIRIPAIRNELRQMIMQRNELACFVRERHAQLPPMLKKENMCNRCYAKTTCFIYHKLADDGNSETSGMKTKFDEEVKHLTAKHKEFFLKWDDLLTKEEKESLKFRRELWTMLSTEREKLGRCFSNVIIEPGSAYEEVNNPKINRFRYSLTKQDPTIGFSFLDSQMVVGEPIVISDEKGHFALANGYVTHVRKQRITVAVDRRLHNARIRQPEFDDINNQVFASIMEVAPEGSSVQDAEGKIVEPPINYRLDKDEFSNGMATVRNNIIQVMADRPFGSRQIRGLVVDLNAPRFKSKSTAYTLRDRASINVDQRRAIEKVMSAEDYALVLGMPGTGKTTTIAHIIRALVSQGKSVLLTSYTHTAVDNILLKLKDDGIPILRLGTIAKISMEVQEFATLAATTKTSFEEIKSAWHGTPIVATTCLGINHSIFNERTFDYCIVDEASQITLPVCLGPIRLAKTFILVGDHYQLPPLVQNEEARLGGLDISLFKHLSDTHPSSVVYLEHQYRMCEDVMTLSNSLIYNGRLKCGNQEVAKRCIIIPNMDGLKNHHFSASTLSRSQKSICLGPTRSRCWLRDLLDPDTKVSFINTDPLLPLSREEAKGNRIVNPTEAHICAQLVESFLSVGIPASSIGVMTHYRSQLALLKHGLRHHSDVEMHTADRFQGRDKEVIILSLVRSNEAKSIGELLKDWRRINVAFTRAKTKLLVIGSSETLKGNGPKEDGSEEMVAKFVKLMEQKRWVFDIPTGALEEHLFEDAKTQVTDSVGCTQWKSDELQKMKKIGAKLEDQENIGIGSGKRQPNKKVFGNKPFKLPQMSVLTDVVNEALY